ncbi:helix-turn-helix transcriptional regulator [Aquimarina sp. MMG016]|uniref:helix-turn-helix domain-containing protein n=1 Tax=Aquimarina sp. MMG016 TaxID=2822690 RepID=UPI001B3A0EA5|nr:helix-turn-helix transcriptional regulator [Aquimarina sp. MMG016]MBQ4821514.1 helix-turn-helix transcriptional regulator [Aquimarina sp. MMG016]
MASETKKDRLSIIGERIRELRLKAGYTSYETFAVDNGLPRKNYWRIEKGQNFTIETLLRILDIHNISLEDFFKGLP